MSNDTEEDLSMWDEALDEQAEASDGEGDNETSDGAGDSLKNDDNGDAHAITLETFENDAPITGDEKRKLDAILDIPVTIAMEVGRSNISIRNLLQLNQGSVVELDRVAGESLDVMVNGTLIAHGEVVVVNDKFGIRLTDVISQVERIKKLK